MMKYSSLWVVFFVISLMSHGWSQGLGKDAHKIVKAHKKAVVVIEAVLNIEYLFDGEDTKPIELKKVFTAIVIDPKGLALASHTSIHASLRANGKLIPEEHTTIEISSVKMILDKGKEIDYKVILRDKDLDLAFFMPTEEVSSPFSYIPLENKNVKAEVIEELIVLDRFFDISKTPLGVFTLYISSIIKKPRTFYLSPKAHAYKSAPVFKKNGSLLGIILQQNSSAEDSSESFFAIMPVKEIIEAVKQAKDEMGN